MTHCAFRACAVAARCVTGWDRRSSLAEIERSAGLILRGHPHEACHGYRGRVRHGGVLELAAAACYETSEHPDRYHLNRAVAVRPARSTRACPVRYWEPARRDWRPDLNAFGAPGAICPCASPPDGRS